MTLFLTFAVTLILIFVRSTQSLCASPTIDTSAKKDLLLPIAVISDLDSKLKDATSWYSILKYGTLALDQNHTSSFIHWLGSINITSSMNFNQRAMELSDLKIFNGRLLSVDDKLGIVYWIRNGSVVPWVITSTGSGDKNRPFKGEWLTIRNGDLILGSSGHEIVTPEGEYISDDEMFIRLIAPDGVVRIDDWTPLYVKLRTSMGIHFPGYMIHEAVQWSDVHKKWFFLPRYASKLPYKGETIFETGSNVLISTSDCFCDFKITSIGKWDAYRGYSAFQFVPGTNDELIAALRTIEIPWNLKKVHGKKRFATFITVFSITGKVILDDTLVDENVKYEGLEFADVSHCL